MIKRQLQIIAVLLLLICALLGQFFLSDINIEKIKYDATYYDMGIDFDVFAKSKVDISKGYLVFEKTGLECHPYPLYVKGEDKILLSTKMVYYKPAGADLIEKTTLPLLSEVSFDNNTKNIEFEKGKKNFYSQTGFLFDGHNTYIVLTDMKIECGEKSFVLPPLSYVEVDNDNFMLVFNSKTEETETYYINDPVFASDDRGTYTIIMSSDVTHYNKKEILMPSNLELYKNSFEVYK